MQVMTLTNLQSSFLLYAMLFFFSLAEVLRHLVMKSKRTRGGAAGFSAASSGLLHIPSIFRGSRETNRGDVQFSFNLTLKRRKKKTSIVFAFLIVCNQSLERPGNVPVDKYSAHLIRGRGGEEHPGRKDGWAKKKEKE